MKHTRTYGPWTITYERKFTSLDKVVGIASYTHHRLSVRHSDGREVTQPWQPTSVPVTFESFDGRRFVGQAFTDLLPPLFEIVPADDERLSLAEAPPKV